MGLSGAMYTGLTGMSANSAWINNAGNNIANANTLAYKASAMHFQTQVSQMIRSAAGPSATSGGRNPTQVGMGVAVGSTTRNFTDGSGQPTGVATNMAISGDGFFVIDVNGSLRYTRAGDFTRDPADNLVNSDGNRLQGYGIDNNFNLVQGILTDITIPLNKLTIAQASTQVTLGGALDKNGDAATQGSINTSDALYSDSAATTAATTATALTSLYTTAGGATPRFAAGDVITLQGVQKGLDNEENRTLQTYTFEVGAANTTGSDDYGATVQDFLDFLGSVLGVDSSQGDGAGVTLDVSGRIVVQGNSGTLNDLTFADGSVAVGSNASFGWAKTQQADGTSARTTVRLYDSLGTAVDADVTMVLDSKDNNGTHWRYYVHADADTDLDTFIDTGTVDFDTDGRFTSSSASTFTIDRDNTGSGTPLAIALGFDSKLTATDLSEVGTQQQITSTTDGSPVGVLTSFQINSDGVIMGKFNNNMDKTLGQIVLAMFSNNAGMVEEGHNIYNASLNSGQAVLTAPTQYGSGGLNQYQVEGSNVDLSNEFINLINASTGYSAASRVINTTTQLIQELLAAVR
ncbi:MAG: flagellar hook-basal body complex protein [Phycisphaeraceae bacterium]|nr:flagellar hook-basal body complex protein [Phycisphaeraceae bacterium]